MHALFSVCSLRDNNMITSKPTRKLKHANSILESSEYFCQISSKLIHVISSYTVSKLGRFLRHSVDVFLSPAKNVPSQQLDHTSHQAVNSRQLVTQNIYLLLLWPVRYPEEYIRGVDACVCRIFIRVSACTMPAASPTDYRRRRPVWICSSCQSLTTKRRYDRNCSTP